MPPRRSPRAAETESDSESASEYSHGEESTQSSSPSASASESEFSDRAATRGRAQRRTPVPRRSPTRHAPPAAAAASEENTAAAASSVAAAGQSAADGATLPPSAPVSMRFASTGETAQGTLAGASGHLLARASLSRSSTDGSSLRPTSGVLSSKSSWGLHVCDHPGCTKAFEKVGKLNRHKLAHTGVKSFACTHPGCDKSFTRNDRLRRHWKIHQNDAAGGTSARAIARRKSFLGSKQAEEAERTDALATIHTGVHEIESRSAAEDSMHELLSGSDVEAIVPTAVLRATPTPNTAAKLVLLTPASAAAATAAAIPPTLPPLVKFPCTVPGCDQSFLLREHLKRHADHTHSAEELAQAAADSKATAAAGGGKKTYPCTHIGCFLTFDKAHKLREHAFVHTGVMPWICNMPTRPTTTTTTTTQRKLDLQKHQEEDAQMNEDEDEHQATSSASTTAAAAAAAAPSASSSALPSPLCTEGFLTRSSLLKHQHLHHTPARFLCDVAGCAESFARFLELRKHRAEVHARAEAATTTAGSGSGSGGYGGGGSGRARSHECEECGEVVPATKADRAAHQASCPAVAAATATAPSSAQRLACPFVGCLKSFSRKGNLNVHIRTTHDGAWVGATKPKKESAGETAAAAAAAGGASNEEDAPEKLVESSAPSVLRFLCPFPVCAGRMQTHPYKVKRAFQRHLETAHGLTHAASRDADAIALAVAIDAASPNPRPLPPHPNTKKRKDARTAITGAIQPFGHKKAARAAVEAAAAEATAATKSTSNEEAVVAMADVVDGAVDGVGSKKRKLNAAAPDAAAAVPAKDDGGTQCATTDTREVAGQQAHQQSTVAATDERQLVVGAPADDSTIEPPSKRLRVEEAVEVAAAPSVQPPSGGKAATTDGHAEEAASTPAAGAIPMAQ